MRKIVVAIVGAVAFTSVMAGTAVAGGFAGPYGSLSACKVANKKYDAKYDTGPCFKTAKGYFFKYA